MCSRKQDRIFRRLVASIILIHLSACSGKQNSHPPEELGEENRGSIEMNATATGALAGGLLGGGLGAVVGSVSGNAGGGLAIGTAAGGATGALIGYYFDESKAATNEQSERLHRQQEEIERQRREIDELRRRGLDPAMRGSMQRTSFSRTGVGSHKSSNASSSQDHGIWVSSFNRPSVFEGNSLNSYRGSPRAKPFTQVALISSHPIRTGRRKASAIPSGENQSIEKVSTTPVTVRAARELEANKESQRDMLAVRTPDEAPPPEAAPVTTLPPAQTGTGGVSSGVAATPQRAQEIADRTQVPPPTSPGVAIGKATEVPGFDCELARAEADRARRAISDADRLFYYRRALKLCPSEAKYHVEIGQVYASIGRKDDAKFEFQQALDLNPHDLEAQRELAVLQGR